VKSQPASSPIVQTSLDDLLDFGGSSTGGSTQTILTTQPNTVDLIGDLLGGGPSLPAPQ
jgi:hypothetical protein